MATDNICFYLQNRLIQTSQTGGQQNSDTSPFSIPWWVYQQCIFVQFGLSCFKLVPIFSQNEDSKTGIKNSGCQDVFLLNRLYLDLRSIYSSIFFAENWKYTIDQIEASIVPSAGKLREGTSLHLCGSLCFTLGFRIKHYESKVRWLKKASLWSQNRS
jgi:hypothetical protein